MAQTFRPNPAERRKCNAQFTPRYRELDYLERYVKCTQYEGRPGYFEDADVPVRERRPCVNYPIVRRAIKSNVDLVLGEGRFPVITSHTSEDDSELDGNLGLSVDDSELLDGFVRHVVRQARVKNAARQMLADAQACRTSVAIGCVEAGKLKIRTVKAKWCTRDTDPEDPSKTTRLEVRYPYLERYYDSARRCWTERAKLYRRVVDSTSDNVWSALCPDNPDDEPKWILNRQKSREHGLGFCPVVWYKNLPDTECADNDDGLAIHEELFDNIDALNFSLSQRHRAAFVNGNPTTVETGVEADYNQAPAGRAAQIIQGPQGTWEAGKDPVLGYAKGARTHKKRRGTGVAWRYENKDAKVSLLTLPGDALKPLEEDAQDLVTKLAEAMNVVFINLGAGRHAAEFSGKALQVLYKPQIAACDLVRDDFGENCLLRLVDMMLRIAFVVDRKRKGSVYVPGIAKVRGILARFEQDRETSEGGAVAKDWFPPHLDLVWGPYFEPDPEEENLIITGAALAKEKGIITRQKAVERVASIFNIEDVAEFTEELEREAQENMEQEQELMHAMNGVANGSERNSGGQSGAAPRRAKAPKKAKRGGESGSSVSETAS